MKGVVGWPCVYGGIFWPVLCALPLCQAAELRGSFFLVFQKAFVLVLLLTKAFAVKTFKRIGCSEFTT